MRTSRGLPCSSERLVRKAVHYGIVDHYEESPDVVRFEMSGRIAEMDPFHARMLLCNRLRAEGVARATLSSVEEL